MQRSSSLAVKQIGLIIVKSRPEFSSCCLCSVTVSGCNRAFKYPDDTKQLWSVGECSHALHIRVHHFLFRHVSIRGIRLRDAKLGNISVLSSFIRWRTDNGCCSSGATRWYWTKLDISPQVFQISIIQFTGFLSTKVINNEPYNLAFKVLSSSKPYFHYNISTTVVRTLTIPV